MWHLCWWDWSRVELSLWLLACWSGISVKPNGRTTLAVQGELTLSLHTSSSLWCHFIAIILMSNMDEMTLSISLSSIRARPRRSNASLIMRRLEEVSSQPVHPPEASPSTDENDPLGLPTYEQAIAKSGQHDAPPPPYPGYLHMVICSYCIL